MNRAINPAQIGAFIAQCRKEKNMTQMELAEQLHLTDRAVSKWECGKSLPDASVMLALCELLGITVNELLSGERMDRESREQRAEENLIALTKAAETDKKANTVLLLIFSAVLLLGMIVCVICDLALSGFLTWSLIPLLSIAFCWLICAPGILLGRRGIAGSLLSLSLFILPYLFLLGSLVGVKEVFSIGRAAALVSLGFLWILFGVFQIKRIGKLTACGIACLLAIFFQLVMGLVLSRLIGEPAVDVWDLLSILILLTAAVTCFLCARFGKRRHRPGARQVPEASGTGVDETSGGPYSGS